MVVFFALLSAISYGAGDFFGGLSSRRNSAMVTVVWAQGAGLLTALFAVSIFGSSEVLTGDLFWGAAAGLFGALGLIVLFRGFSVGIVSIVSPVAALTGAVLPAIFGFILGERLPLLTWIGITLSLPAILLLSCEKKEKSGNTFRSIRLGFLAGVMFSGFFIFISRTSDASGIWPLVAARAVTTPFFLMVCIVRKNKLRLANGTGISAIASGFLDMAANFLYLLAARTGFLIIAVILTSLYPAPTVIMQRIFLHENLTYLRIAGLILSITGAALIGVGG